MKRFFSFHVREDFGLHVVLVLGPVACAVVILAQWLERAA